MCRKSALTHRNIHIFAKEEKRRRKPKMSFVDAHAHIYPEKIAQRAVESVRQFYLVEQMYAQKGTVENLLSYTKTSPITHFIAHSVAVKPKNVESINNFIAQCAAEHPEIIGFMAMHQDFEDPETEINRAMGLGLCGIKLHPDTQQVNADDPRLMNVYEIAQAKGLPVIIHTGDYRYNFSRPERIARILRAFPDLVVNAAHFGGWSIYDVGADVLCSERCFVDTSSALEYIGLRHAKELINMYGCERVMFGSDHPMWSPAKECELIAQVGLSAHDYENITWHNAEKFLGRKI